MMENLPKRRLTTLQLVLLTALQFVQSKKFHLRLRNKEEHLHEDDGKTSLPHTQSSHLLTYDLMKQLCWHIRTLALG